MEACWDILWPSLFERPNDIPFACLPRILSQGEVDRAVARVLSSLLRRLRDFPVDPKNTTEFAQPSVFLPNSVVQVVHEVSSCHSSLMSIELDHADLIIPNGSEAIAREFYCDLLGLQEIEKPDVLRNNGGLWLQLGNAQIHLSYEKKEGIDPRKTKAHIAFRVSDLDNVIEALRKRGYPVKKQEQLPGMIRIESEDPFGHRIEFLQVI